MKKLLVEKKRKEMIAINDLPDRLKRYLTPEFRALLLAHLHKAKQAALKVQE